MNTHELLIAARKRIERPECWTQGCEARDANGEDDDAESPEACQWCGYGAIWSQGGFTNSSRKATSALDLACGCRFPLWQDRPERTHEDVLKVFDIAIENERAKAEGVKA